MSDRFYKQFAIPYELYGNFTDDLKRLELTGSRLKSGDFYAAPLLDLTFVDGKWIQTTTVECNAEIGTILTLKYGQYIVKGDI